MNNIQRTKELLISNGHYLPYNDIKLLNLSPIDNQFTAVIGTLSQFKIQITALSNQLKSLEKTVKKEIKQHKKE